MTLSTEVDCRLEAAILDLGMRLSVGNLYFNRRITGARVAVQPFDGPALSGGGIQAGGQAYPKQFPWRRTVTANKLRQGRVAFCQASLSRLPP